ncbi:hypothetical protein L3Q82_011094, partial [Scortum barcoo]
MSGLRRHFNMGLVLVMCALTGHCGRSAPSAAPPAAPGGGEAQRHLRRIVEIVKHVEESRGRHATRTEAPSTWTSARPRGSAAERKKDLRNLKVDRGDQAVVVFPRDLRKKEKFIQHITGKTLLQTVECQKSLRNESEVRSTSVPSAGSMCTDSTTTPETARYLHVSCSHTDPLSLLLQKMCAASHTTSWQPAVHRGVAQA